MQEQFDDFLKPGVLLEVTEIDRAVVQGPYVTSKYLLLEFSKLEWGLMRDGCIYECVVLEASGVVSRILLHEKEVMGIQWFVSRSISFIR